MVCEMIFGLYSGGTNQLNQTYMATQGNVTISPTQVTYKGKTLDKVSIASMDYKEPSGWPMALIRNFAKYGMLVIVLIGIPMAIYNAAQDVNNYRVVIQLKNKKANKDRFVTWYLTRDEWGFMKNNY